VKAIAISPINLLDLIDPKKCYALIRFIRWGESVTCPKCGSDHVIKKGFDDIQPERQRYQCKGCQARFDDLSDSIFAGHHQPLGVWILCLYLMGLNLSNQQIAQELDLNKDDTQQMASQLRSGIVEKKPEVILEEEVEMDEVYLVAGFKGQPLKVAQKQRKGRQRRLKGKPGRGTLDQEKPPIFGMMQRGGEAIIKMLYYLQHVTIKPLIEKAVALGTLVFTDEYGIDQRL
jgi:transposase-like protein